MPGPEFFQTRMGARFFEVTAPRIAEELAALNANLKELVAVLREGLAARARVPAPPEGGAGGG